MEFEELRKKHKQLIYEGFRVLPEDGNLKVVFHFLLTPDIRFEPFVVFPNISKKRIEEIGPKIIENLVFNLGMVELLSYWKTACPLQIQIKAGYLDNDQVKFWKKLLIKGLGEFFYTNKIDFTTPNLVKIISYLGGRTEATPRVYKENLKDRDLVLVGGGKDSAVTLEEISMSNRESKCLLLNPTKAAEDIVKAAGSKEPIIVKRTIDPKLLKLNQQGYLNGHTPFSAYLAFLSTFAGVLYDYKNIIASNESSSNEGNVFWKGQEINHQYSKSFEFEEDFRDYCKKYLSFSSNYFSYLRTFSELQISEKFSRMEKYHKLFRSCNKGSKEGIWCGKCPKCISTYLLLYPFLGKKTAAIFGRDLLQDESLIPLVGGLLRENNVVKPFECVATVEEIRQAISLGVEKAKKDLPAGRQDGQKIPKVLAAFQQKTLILGFGREGNATYNYLKKHYPHLKIDTADQKDGENYLDTLKNYDVIIKSPGIPYLPEILQAKNLGKTITSATKIFFDKFSGKIIGITGTKGKSTTASLIYQVLKEGGVNVHLIGNIGKPVLDLLDKLKETDVVVFELSSFQLADLSKSPHIAVMTNIYPEHLDHHGDFSNYLKSKNNITAFQSEKDYLIYNEDNPELKVISQKTKANKIPFSKKDYQMVESLVQKDAIPLLGDFNLLNIIPAIIIGRLFKVSDNKIEKAIINFNPLPHRLEFAGEFKGIRFYNDSLATNPQATIVALQTLGKNAETLIAGGYDRGLDFAVLGEAIAKSKIKTLILFPDTGEKILRAVKSAKCPPKARFAKGDKVQSFRTDNMEEAVKKAYEVTAPGKIVLLSPASSSFNLFKDYADRGSQFRDWVKKLGSD